MITIQPYGGLGNRLRSLDSAIALSECTGKKLEVIWDSNEELRCPFSKLFELPDKFDLIETQTHYFPRKVKEKFSIALHKLKIKYPFSYDSVLHEEDIQKLKSSDYDFCQLGNYRNIFIMINGRFLYPSSPFRYLQALPAVKEKVDSITSDFNGQTIGVHIRRTDNKLSIKKSPISRFIELMEEERSNGDVRFYLSTDSPEAEDYLVNHFSGQIICFEKELSRNKEQGIIDALVDMLCLSRTSRIIGSYYSSFSEVAGEIGNIPVSLAMADD